MKRLKAFTKPLESTVIGWLVFAFLLPCLALWNGIGGLATGEINIRGADVVGLPARLYGAGMICFGIGTLALPRFHGDDSTFHSTRVLAGGLLFVIFLLAGTISLFV